MKQTKEKATVCMLKQFDDYSSHSSISFSSTVFTTKHSQTYFVTSHSTFQISSLLLYWENMKQHFKKVLQQFYSARKAFTVLKNGKMWIKKSLIKKKLTSWTSLFPYWFICGLFMSANVLNMINDQCWLLI